MRRWLLLVESRVEEIDVFLVHAAAGQLQGLAEALEVDDFPLPEKADGVVDVRIIGETENIVVGKPGLLLCGQILRQVGDGVAGGLNAGGAPGEAAGCLLYTSDAADEL